MTQKAAICKALLEGQTLSIMNGFNYFSCTNIPREIGRSIERKFNVEVDRQRKVGKSKYGMPCTWFEYSFSKSKNSPEAIEKMKEYIKKHTKQD